MKAGLPNRYRRLADDASRPSASSGERGSALLIVLVFAAIILIMLYKEMPVATFEAQRQKEQLAIDRGHEYARAVQLFYRKFRGQYPPSIDALQSTNGMRFLRRKYKDPLTGKDDWRLLHAGPGGMLTDSKVNPMGIINQNGATGQAGTGLNQSGSQPGNSTALSVPNSDSSDANSVDLLSPDGQTGAKVRHSPPAIAANGSAAGASSSSDATANGVPPVPDTPTSAQLDADPSKPLLPASSNTSTQTGAANQAGQTGTQPNAANGTNPAAAATGQAAMNAVTANNAGVQAGTIPGGGGGIAGVASIAKGHGIKKVNEQDDYTKWEFYYDPTKDTGAGGGSTGVQNNTQAQGAQGMSPTQNNNQQPSAGTSTNNPTPTTGDQQSGGGAIQTPTPQ